MCELEPIPLMLEPMKDPKLISLVCKARKGQGVHNYIKSVCVPSPAYQLSLMRQYYPHQVLKITTVNYVLEDNPEFRLRLWNANVIVKEINLTLKDGDVGVDYQTFKRKEEYDDEIILDTKVDLNVNHKVHLKKGEYIVASVSCKMSEKTTCVNYRECTSIGTLQFEFNGVELVTYPMELKYLNVLFRALKMYGLKDRTSAREVHQEYSNVSESFALFTMQKMYDVAALQFRSFDNYLWAGDWAVVTGKYKYMNADFEGNSLRRTSKLGRKYGRIWRTSWRIRDVGLSAKSGISYDVADLFEHIKIQRFWISNVEAALRTAPCQAPTSHRIH
ncbi:uncharacterized protein [Dermacentor andersoni]|uniref:uncharacterized protein isoform X10 n=1 Tax=Dermacentor andersoni TaxID=34620 RepID=UPI003B3B58EF